MKAFGEICGVVGMMLVTAVLAGVAYNLVRSMFEWESWRGWVALAAIIGVVLASIGYACASLGDDDKSELR